MEIGKCNECGFWKRSPSLTQPPDPVVINAYGVCRRFPTYLFTHENHECGEWLPTSRVGRRCLECDVRQSE